VSSSARTCPDCQSEMESITLIDAADVCRNHQQLAYAAGDAKRSWFLGRYAEQGKVGAQMCTTCGRIVLHGEVSEADRPTGTCVLRTQQHYELDVATSALREAGIPCSGVPDDAAVAAREVLLGLTIGGVVEDDA
jgi:hypothetical protein